MKLFLVVLLTVGVLGSRPRRNHGRIVGGTDAPEGAYPFIVKLQDFSGPFCAGAIIDEFTVVTAAHCVPGLSPDSVVIVAGTNQLNSGGDEYKVSDIRVHDNFVSVIFANDIAILKIVGPIHFSDKVQSIELQTEFLESDVDCIGMGWGSLYLGGSQSANLQHIRLKTVSTDTCQEVFDSLSSFVISYLNLCTFTKSGEGTCRGDSGGPLMCNGKFSGIVSGGEPCAVGYPDVFTRVTSFQDWIEEHRH